MKILMLSDAQSIHTKRWVESLSVKNIEIILFSLTPSTNGWYDGIKNVKVECASYELSSTLLSKISYLSVLSRLRRLIKRELPDIIHAHYASSYGLLGALVKTNIPYIISVWGSDIYDFPKVTPFGKQIIKYNLNHADYILSTSHVMAKETQKYTDKPISVTPFGVDTNLFKPLNVSLSDNFIIGNVKSLRPIYGIDILIKAANIVIKKNPQKQIQLDIYGDGPQKEELIQLTKDLGIEDKVKFKGFLQNDKLPKVYNNVSVSVSVSNAESFGVVAVEAMACGCPVITSDADGFNEVVENGKTGYIVPKRNPEATACAIQRFIDNPSYRESMGQAGRLRVKKFYDWDKNVETMYAIYQNIISKNKRKMEEKQGSR